MSSAVSAVFVHPDGCAKGRIHTAVRYTFFLKYHFSFYWLDTAKRDRVRVRVTLTHAGMWSVHPLSYTTY